MLKIAWCFGARRPERETHALIRILEYPPVWRTLTRDDPDLARVGRLIQEDHLEGVAQRGEDDQYLSAKIRAVTISGQILRRQLEAIEARTRLRFWLTLLAAALVGWVLGLVTPGALRFVAGLAERH